MLRRLAIVALIVAGLSIGGASAWAFWGAAVNAGAAGGGLAASVNAATTPTVNQPSSGTVTVTWPAVTLNNGVAVDGYVVKRYHSSTLITQTVMGTCAGTVTALTCTETPVPGGTWKYSVYPRIGTNWTGTESGLSLPVTVTAPTITLAKTVYNAAASTTGTLSGFGVNEAVSYRLDSSPALTGFPGVVDTSGSAPISSLAIPVTSEGTHTVYAIGANGSLAATMITYDSVAPTVNISLSPAANGAGWNNSTTSVTLAGSDATSGIASIKYTTDGSDPTVSGTLYSGPFNVAANATVRYFATDVAGNASSVGSRLIKIDTVSPSGSLALSSASNALLSGGTVWFRGTAGGSFALTDTVTDASSGPASSATAALTGTTVGWTHTPATVMTPPGGPYVSNTFTFGASTTAEPGETVTRADVAGNTSSAVLAFKNDSAGPTGGSAAISGGAYAASTSLTITTAKGTDAGVGLASTGFLLQRATATLTGGTCGTFGSFSTVTTNPAASYPDTVTDQACYRYQYVAPDLLGNSTSYVSGDVKVDLTAPSAPTFAYSALTSAYGTGNTVYYRRSGSGSFTVTASSADTASGIGSYTFPAVTGFTPAAGSLGVNTYSWSSTTAAPATPSITATNGAGLTNSTTLNLVDDSAGPTGGSLTYNAGYLTGASVNSVALAFTSGSDALSGLDTSAGVIQRRSAALVLGVCDVTYSAWTAILTTPPPGSPTNDTTVVGDMCYQYQYVTYDRVGNSTAYPANSNPVVKVPMYYTCQAAATGGSAIEYYKLNEASGAVATDSSGNGRPGAYAGVGAYNVPSVCGSNGVTFAAAAGGYVGTSYSVNNPTTFSEEVWFKTSSGNSMRLMGFGDKATGLSNSYDRTVYLNTSSQLVFGFNIGTLSYRTITTTATYSDNKWHHVVATASPANGMKLYVDGALNKFDNTGAVPQNYAGFWRLGSDSMGGWPALTILINSYTDASLSNGAFYSRELSTQEVFDHYVAAQLTSGAVLTAPTSLQSVAQSAALSARKLAATASASPSPSPSLSPSPSGTPSSPAPTTPSPGIPPSFTGSPWPSGSKESEPESEPEPEES